MATGSHSSYHGHDEWREWAPSLKSIEEATGVRHRIFYAFEVAERIVEPEQRRAWLTFVIVLRPFPEDLSRKASRTLARLGVEVRTGLRVKSVDKEGLTYQGPDGGHPDVYVIGDMALSIDASGRPLAGVAQVAVQQGAYAAHDIVRKLRGKPPLPPFKYFDKGRLAVIGRWAAVANAFGVHLWGLPAWILWAFIHLAYLVQFQSRILVFIKWGIQDLTFSRGRG